MESACPKDASGKLFDHLMTMFGLKNDAALARWLGVAAPVVSKVRHDRLPIGATLILHIHELSELPVATIRALIAG